MTKVKLLVLPLAALFAIGPAAMVTAAPQQNPASLRDRVEVQQDNLNENLHKGKRCSFTKLEAIITGVGWFVGVIPGAILTPLTCKKDLFK